MQAPEFWHRRGWEAAALAPAGLIVDLAGRWRRAHASPWVAPVPVVCVGNLIVGGAGKTPTVLALAAWLRRRHVAVHLLTRGYGGALAGPVRVDPAIHDFLTVGDESLLLAQAAPSWVAQDRAAGAQAAIAAGAGLILMDDGLQNPSLRQDLRLIVVDGGYGFGNRHVLPAGPLRENLRRGLARADAAILIGEDRTGAAELLAELPLVRAFLKPRAPVTGRVLAFAGIGRPQKFFESLRSVGAMPVECAAFPDHHAYREGEIAALLDRAEASGARLVTTAKDAVRLPPGLRPRIAVLEVDLAWTSEADAAVIEGLLDPLIALGAASP